MKVLDAQRLNDLASALAGAGYRVIAPVEEGDVVRVAGWSAGARIRTDVYPVNSAKDFLLPRSEVVGAYALDGGDFAAKEVAPEAARTVLLCVRPCDAASLAALDAVFHWDYEDEFYNARRAATAVVALTCASADDQCFCTSVGGRPDSTAGADAVLRPADGGRQLILDALTDKGQAVASAASALLAEAVATVDAPANVPARFDARGVTDWLAGNFDSPLWIELSLPCLGCGACAYACPACHCFDIQDEATRTRALRYRNWDSCGLALFTLHAAGHNPRPDQSARWRQRVMHKFSYFPQRFAMLSCTGCGRCARICPAGMAIAESCRRIDEAAKVAK